MFAWLVPAEPMYMPKPETAGSAPTTAATRSTLSTVLENDESCEPSMTPVMKPVSCCGKKPVLAVM